MSKQKANGRKAEKAVRAAEETRLRKLRIALAALLAVAVVAGGACGIRALVKRHARQTEPTGTSAASDILPEDLASADYTYVDYKGMQMPAVFADLMREGETLRAELCKEGVVMKVGSRDISQTEFEMYYYDQYRKAKKSAESTLSTYGQNRSGFDPEKLPGDQIRSGTSTWEAYFKEEAEKKLRYEASCYEMAAQAGTKMNDYSISLMQERINGTRLQAELDKVSEDELFRNSYDGLNVSATLYYTRLIMNAMTSSFQAQWSNAYADGLSQQALQAAFDADPHRYQAIDARIYMVEAQDADAAKADAAKVRTEQELIAFAQKYHPNKDVDMNVFTDFRCTRYSIVDDTYGEAVSSWLFDESREIGVCGLIDDGLFLYLAVPLSKPYLSTSVEAELMAFDFMKENEDSVAEMKAKAEDFCAQVKAAGGNAEAFEKIALENGEDAARNTVSITDFTEYGPAVYLFDPARKPGDLTLIKQEDYYLAAMFLQKNAEDFDWIDEVKMKLVSDDWEKTEADFETDNAGKLNEKVAAQAISAVNARLETALKNS